MRAFIVGKHGVKTTETLIQMEFYELHRKTVDHYCLRVAFHVIKRYFENEALSS